MSALGCYAASVITAVTVQNTMGVSAVHAVPPEIVAGQIRAVMDDIKPRAVKVGMVNDIDTINAIADTLANYDIQHLVVDPVMVATSGARLMQDEAVEVFTKKLLPMASLLTPNVPEAEVLAGIPINDKDSMEKAAHIIHSKGCKALLNLVVTHPQANPLPIHLCFRGLEEDAVYELDGIDYFGSQYAHDGGNAIEDGIHKGMRFSGSTLLYAGLVLPQLFGDYPSVQLPLTRQG